MDNKALHQIFAHKKTPQKAHKIVSINPSVNQKIVDYKYT